MKTKQNKTNTVTAGTPHLVENESASLMNLRDSRGSLSFQSFSSIYDSSSQLKRPSIDRLSMDRQVSSDSSDLAVVTSPPSSNKTNSTNNNNNNNITTNINNNNTMSSATGGTSDDVTEFTEFTDTTVMSSTETSVTLNSNANSNSNININSNSKANANTNNKMSQRYTIYDKSGKSEATIDLFGATLLSWKVNEYGGEQMFVSKLSYFDNIQAIRGGIPIVFPQFALNGKMPLHGFARVLPWKIKEGSLNYDINGLIHYLCIVPTNVNTDINKTPTTSKQ